MAYCPSCGTAVENNQAFCAKCGARQPQSLQYGAYGDDVSRNKGMAILSYLSILVLIPFFAAEKSPFARFHAVQGLNLFIWEVIYGIASSFLKGIFFYMPVMGHIVVVLFDAGSLFFVVVSIMGIIFAANGEMKELPLISKLKFVNK